VTFSRGIFVGLLASILIGYAVPTRATTVTVAEGLCRARGSDCKEFGGGGYVVLCVNNSSTGNGVQCVVCPPKQNNECQVMRMVPGSGRGNAVQNILTNKAEKAKSVVDQ